MQIVHSRVRCLSAHDDISPVSYHFRAQLFKQNRHCVNVGYVRTILHDNVLARQNSGGKNRQNRIFCAVHFNSSRKRISTDNFQILIRHTSLDINYARKISFRATHARKRALALMPKSLSNSRTAWNFLQCLQARLWRIDTQRANFRPRS